MKTLIPKSEARRIVIRRRQEIPPAEMRLKTKLVLDRLKASDDFIHADTIHCYISSRPGEVDTRSLIDDMTGCGKSVIVPKLNKSTKSFRRFHFMGWDKIIKNSEGYWEPMFGMDEDLSDIDLIIVPALAVSLYGQRVGYGGGYYDKLLKHSYAPKIVPAFEFQIFAYVENTIHDVRVDKIITERRVINTREPGRGY